LRQAALAACLLAALLAPSAAAAAQGDTPRVLATGDSMIQIVDSYMEQGLGSRAELRSDAHISTGLAKPWMLDWPRYARRQARRLKPDAVVMVIGANDGYSLDGKPCCGSAWVDEYAERARAVMRAFGRRGRTKVYWLLLPAAREGFFRELFPAVNAGIEQAAVGLEENVRVVDLVKKLTPGGRYRASMKIRGRRVRVRQSDGVHLTNEGAAYVARLVIRELRRDGLLG
jgi:hypothetical protein